MISKLRRMVAELFVPTNLETDTASQRAFHKALGSIGHVTLGAAATYALAAAVGVLTGASGGIMAGVMVMSWYFVKEFLDWCEGGSLPDIAEDVISTAIGVLLFSTPLVTIAAIIVGCIVFYIHI